MNRTEELQKELKEHEDAGYSKCNCYYCNGANRELKGRQDALKEVKDAIEDLKSEINYNKYDLGEMGLFVHVSHVMNFIEEFERKLDDFEMGVDLSKGKDRTFVNGKELKLE